MNATDWTPLANHVWQSTLFAGAAGLLTLVFRRNRAAVRHGLWLAASVKFLVPFALLTAVGGWFEWSAGTRVAAPVSSAILQVSEPFAAAETIATAEAPSEPWGWLGGLAIAIWFGGCTVAVMRWRGRWLRIHSAMRASIRLPIGGPVEVRSSPARLEPGIFGIFRPVLMLPEGIAERLTAEQFQAILAHEFCHVRRRDHLAAALHMVVEAVFWFHPLVWWIGGRLIAERERACDEEVLRLGSEPDVYAAGILNVCRFFLESPLACAPGVTGADLKQRIEDIMTRHARQDLTRARKVLLGAAGVAAVAAPVLVGVMPPPAAQAQGAPLRFEVASIKPVKGDVGRGALQTMPGGGLRLSGSTVRQLISFAYHVREYQITGGPRWIDSEGFSIDARPERPDAAGGGENSAPGTASWSRLEQRLQNLLAERFHLVIRKDVKQGPILALTQAKGGSKLQPLEDAENIPPGTMRSANSITGRAGTMNMLAALLSNWLGRPVEDRTGLTGRYSYKVEYAVDPLRDADGVGVEATGPSLYTALQEQLGLKLESTRGDIVTIVIDRVQRPSAN